MPPTIGLCERVHKVAQQSRPLIGQGRTGLPIKLGITRPDRPSPECSRAPDAGGTHSPASGRAESRPPESPGSGPDTHRSCLLYTSDAADDLTRVDLGGRRIFI